MTHDIALLPGDGIGGEVVEATRPLIENVADDRDIDLSFTRYDWGVSATCPRGR